MLRVWNLSLIMATFALTILGTFLTRSGMLSSVHAFAEGEIGYWFLGFIAIVLVFSLSLVAGRSDQLRTEGRLDAVASRETAFLLNNLLFTVFTFTVLFGTLFPLVAEAVRGVKVSVGEPFFNSMTLPLCMALLFLMGVGPALPWRVAPTRCRPARARGAGGAGGAGRARGRVARRRRNGYAIVTFAFGTFALAVNLRQFSIGARARMRAHGEAAPVALAQARRRQSAADMADTSPTLGRSSSRSPSARRRRTSPRPRRRFARARRCRCAATRFGSMSCGDGRSRSDSCSAPTCRCFATASPPGAWIRASTSTRRRSSRSPRRPCAAERRAIST